MSIKNKIPALKSDAAVQLGDTGDAVKQLQTFLQKQKFVQDDQDFQKGFPNPPPKLTDGKIYGTFEKETSRYLQSWQKFNEISIKKAGQLSTQEWQSEIGQLGFASSQIMFGAQKTKVPTTTTPVPDASPIKDPAKTSVSKTETHFVKTRDAGHRLALRKAPAYVAVGKEAKDDIDKKGELVVMMPPDTLLKMIDPWLGYQCQWHQVEVVDDSSIFSTARKLQKTRKLYCYAEFVQPLKGTAEMLPIRCMDCQERHHLNAGRSTPFPDWKLLEECQPFYDIFTCSYYVTITLADTSSDDSLAEKQKKIAVEKGIEALFSFYNKQRKTGDVKRYMAAFEFATAEELYLDERPGSNVVVLVKIPAKYFHAIPYETDFLIDVPNADTGPLPNDWRSAQVITSELGNDIQTVTEELEKFADKVDEWSGEIVGFDFKTEADNLFKFRGILEQFIESSGKKFRESEEDLLEFGFEGPCFRMIYVLINQGETAIPLRIGFECFRNDDAILGTNTMGYIFYLKEIAADIKAKRLSWMKFVQTYVCPIPEIRPSRAPKKKLVKKEIKKTEKKLEEKPIKTKKELDQEDEIIHAPPFKDRIGLAREKISEYTGDSIFDCENIPNLLGRISTMEDLYGEILNKVDIKDVTSFIIQCLAARFLPPDLAFLACRMVLGRIPIEGLEKLLDFLPDDKILEITGKMAIFQEPPINGKIGSNASQLRETIKTVVSKEELCRALTDLDPNLVGDFLLTLQPPDFDDLLHLIPVIEIPDIFYTEDILAAIGDAIIDAIRTILTQVLVALLKEIFSSICELCNPSEDPQEQGVFGGENLNDMFRGSGSRPEGIGKRAFDDYGIGDDFDSDEFTDFLDDLSNILLPSELCSLLDGTATPMVLKLVLKLIGTKYPALKKKLRTTSAVKDFFIYLGSFLSPKICDEINSRLRTPNDDLCTDEDEILRNNLLADKLSSKQLKEQLAKVQKENEEKLERFLALGTDGFAQGLLPPIAGNACAEKNKGMSSIIPRDPPSVEFLNEQVVNTMFDSIHDAFNNDMRGFVAAVLNERREHEVGEWKPKEKVITKMKGFELAYASERLPLAEITKPMKDARLEDPDLSGAGRGKRKIAVAEGVKQSFLNNENFGKENNKFEDSDAIYTYSISATERQKKLAELKKAGDKLVQDSQKSAPQKPAAQKTLIVTPPGKNVKTGVSLTDEVPDSILATVEKCDDEDDNKNAFGIITFDYLAMSTSTAVRYTLPRYAGSAPKIDEFVVETNDKPAISVFSTKDEPKELSNAIKKLGVKYDSKVSARQDLFASFVSKIWKQVIVPADKNKINQGSKFYNYFRDEGFHRIMDDLMDRFALQISSAPTFQTAKFLKVKFLPDITGPAADSTCAPQPDVSLLDISDIKEKTLSNYKKISSVCSKDDKVDPIEKAGQDSVVEVILRVFVVDYVLRAVFVFSEFKTADILADETIIKYLIQKIERSMRDDGSDFFDQVAKAAKALVDRRGDKVENPLLPDEISGVAAMEKLIGEQIETISDMVEEILGTDIYDVGNRMLNIWLLTLSADAAYYKLDSVAGGKISGGPGGNINTQKIVYKQDEAFKNGKLYLQKYIRVTSRDGKDVDDIQTVEDFKKYTPNEFKKSSGQCGYFGLRLMYIPPTEDNNNFTKMMKNEKIDVPSKTATDEKAYNLHLGLAYPFPLVTIENKDIISTLESKDLDEKKELAIAKKTMLQSEDFKLLFKFIFPLQRFISLSMIYNIQAMEHFIPGLDNVFDGTKQVARSLLDILTPGEDWWKKQDSFTDSVGGNAGLRQSSMENIKVDGPTPNLLSLAAMTIPLIIKGMAEKHDESYKLIKNLGYSEDFSSIPKVAPVNIFGPFGFGPPLTSWGILALGTPELPGDKKDREKREATNKIQKDISAGTTEDCDKEKK